MEYKRLGVEDLPDIVRLNGIIFKTMYPWPPYSFEDYEKRLQDVTPFIIGVYDNETLVANSIAFEKDGSFYIWTMGVSETYRGRGIGKKLFAMNEEQARLLGFTTITTKIYAVSRAMTELAVKRGYIKIETTLHPNDSSFDAAIFERTL